MFDIGIRIVINQMFINQMKEERVQCKMRLNGFIVQSLVNILESFPLLLSCLQRGKMGDDQF